MVLVLVVGYIYQLANDASNRLSYPGEVQGAYQIKVTTTALALLLLTRHPELGNVNVHGHLIKVEFYFSFHYAFITFHLTNLFL